MCVADIFKILLLFYMLIVFVSTVITIRETYWWNNDPDFVPHSPTDIYDRTDFNLATCALLFIVLIVVNPINFIVRFLVWITHVGRDDKKGE